MKLSFKNVIYSVILIGFISLAFTLCSKQVFHPIFEKKPDFQDSIVFQSSHEKRIKQNIETFLQKLLGKKLFVVSVVAVLDNFIVEEVLIEKSPNIVSTNTNISTASSLQEDSIGYSQIRPKLKEIRGKLNKSTPSAFSLESLTSPIIDLPGFPIMQQQNNQPKPQQPTEKQLFKGNNWETPKTNLEPNKTFTLKEDKYSQNTQFLINENIKSSIQKDQAIKYYVISIVIDKEFFSYLDIDSAELKTLVSNISGIDYDRGDKLNISFAPFVDKGFSWNYFVKKNKIWLEKFIFLYEKIKPVLFILLIIIGIGGLLILLKRVIQWGIKIQKERALVNEKKIAQQKAIEEENKLSEIEEKKQSLIQLGQTKPEQFILLLNSWIEVEK